MSFLPSLEEIESSAKEMGVIERKRSIGSAEDLLKLILAYSCSPLSLRGVAAWAQLNGIAEISDVALLKKFKKSHEWLGQILGFKLAEQAPPPSKTLGGNLADMKIRLVDATIINEHGSKSIDWRIHIGYNLKNNAIDHIELTDVKGGESLTRFSIKPGELVIGDRGYAHRRGMNSVIESGGDFLIRLNWSNVPLEDHAGNPFNLIKNLRGLKNGEIGDFEVQTKPSERMGLPAIKGRLIAIRKTKEAAKAARLKARKMNKKSKNIDPKTLETAGYVFLFTSMDSSRASAKELLDLYRFRWQIEIAFKRMKGLLKLGELPAKDPDLVRTYLYAKLLSALLLQDLTEVYLGFFPWGFRFP